MKTNKLSFLIVLCLMCCCGLLSSLKAQTTLYDVCEYEIFLDVNHLQANRHIGHTKITLRLSSAVFDSLSLDLKNHNVDSVRVNSQSVGFSYDANKIHLALPDYLTANSVAEVEVYYNGGQVLEPYAWGGIHYEPHIIYTLGVAFADFPHTYGRSWFACNDSFTDKATFKFHITTNNNVRAVCSGRQDSVSYSEDCCTYHWTLSQPIPTYLASMTIADFDLLERDLVSENGTVPLQVYYFASDSSQVYRNFEMFDSAFANMERCFGAFPFNRVGYCTTTQGSMEHVDNISLAHSLAASFSDNSQSVIVHEFGHSWFGNLITCQTAGDMWINEGWTTFTEKLNLEAMYGADYAKNHFRKKAESVLKTLPRTEGVFPLYGADSTLTYSSTIYDKGALVAMSLKAYMGDSLFYSSVRKLLSDFAFANVSSPIMRDSLSAYSGIDLTDFFNYYVFDTVLHHFCISRFTPQENSATVQIQSRTLHNDNVAAAHIRLPITFMDKDFNTCKRQIIDNGNNQEHTFSLPFTPVAAFLDMDEEFFDLTTDSYKKIDQDGLYKFDNSHFRIFVRNCTDTIVVRAVLNWLGEKQDVQKHGVQRFSDKHYWTVEGINLDKADIEARFYFEASGSEAAFDNSLLTSYSNIDSLLLFYRPDALSEWEMVDFERPTSSSGYISVALRKGDYIMAMGDRQAVGLNTPKPQSKALKVFPNPCKAKLNVEHPRATSDARIIILDSLGRMVQNEKAAAFSQISQLDINLPKGCYTLVFEQDNKTTSTVFTIN